MKASRSSATTTREKLLDHALTLFSDRGYAAVGIREIIHAAGVTQPTLYHHFKDKRSLFEELIRQHYEVSQEQLEQVVAANNGCESRLQVMVQSSFDFCLADPRIPRLMFQTYYGPRIPEIDGILDSLTDRRFQLVKRIMVEGIHEKCMRPRDPDFLALTFCCLMDQPLNIFSRRSRPGRFLTPALATEIVDQFLQGAST
ncbi:MAG: TetR/AcrR family transcriptional regulator [Planctomyces sp.]|nr:TetR/AcrR family transcriptional regulator [Planctomyces sp.]